MDERHCLPIMVMAVADWDAAAADYSGWRGCRRIPRRTRSKVNQIYMVASLDLHFSILYGVLKKHGAEDAEYKSSSGSRGRKHGLRRVCSRCSHGFHVGRQQPLATEWLHHVFVGVLM